MKSHIGRDLLLSLGFGVAGLLFFHLDHLVMSYSGWSDPSWLLHLLVDGLYVLVYGALGWLVLRGWRVWRAVSRGAPPGGPEEKGGA